MKWKLLLISLMSSFLFIGCSGVSGGGSGGGGTETGDPGAIARPGSGLVGGATVLDKNGDIAVEDVAVWVDNRTSEKTYSNENGEYLFNDVPAGEHIVYARWRFQDTVYVGRSEKLEIASNKGSQKPYIYLGQNILLSEGASISGIIPLSREYAGANLKAILKDSIYVAKVNADGEFTLPEVIAGDYILEIKKDSLVLFSLAVSVSAGEDLDLGEVTK